MGETRKENERKREKTRENERKKEFSDLFMGCFGITHTSWCVRRGCGSDEGDLILGLCRCRSLEMRLWQRCRLSETSDMVCVVVTTWNNLNQRGECLFRFEY